MLDVCFIASFVALNKTKRNAKLRAAGRNERSRDARGLHYSATCKAIKDQPAVAEEMSCARVSTTAA